MPVAPAFTDSEGLFRDWVNTLEGPTGLVGEGRPLALGAWLKHPRSPYKGAYLYLQAGVADDVPMAGAVSRHTIYGQVYGVTRLQAMAAAVAYANQLRQLYLPNVPMPTPAAPRAICVGVDGITGPSYSPDRDEERFLVDVDLYLVPV